MSSQRWRRKEIGLTECRPTEKSIILYAVCTGGLIHSFKFKPSGTGTLHCAFGATGLISPANRLFNSCTRDVTDVIIAGAREIDFVIEPFSGPIESRASE